MDGWRSKGKQICRHLDVYRQIYLLIDSKVFFLLKRNMLDQSSAYWNIYDSTPYTLTHLMMSIKLSLASTWTMYWTQHLKNRIYISCFAYLSSMLHCLTSPVYFQFSLWYDGFAQLLHYVHTEWGVLPTPWPGPTMVWKKIWRNCQR